MVRQTHMTSTGKPKTLNVEFTDIAWEDFQYWARNDKKKLKKIFDLIKECRRTPYEGTGKPERLKHKIDNIWSRRIDIEHRLVYAVDKTRITIIQCRFHY